MNEDDRRREIDLGETVSVAELERRIDVPAARLVKTAFEELGLLLTIYERVPFERAKELVARFGFVARRKEP
jgi:hypothetical protein